ncbi:TPA: M12 family metallopeptidase [Pseudomonas aeruginosa]
MVFRPGVRAAALCAMPLSLVMGTVQAAEIIAPSDEQIRYMRKVVPQSYVDLARLWKGGLPIPVCWEANVAPFAEQKQWIEDIVRQRLETPTAVRFKGFAVQAKRWPTCTPTALGIRISATEGRPRSDVGKQWSPGPFDPKRQQVPTRVQLDFKLGGAYESFCGSQKRKCLEVIALHEFMHAIGFLHEHLRDDAPQACRETFGHEDDDTGILPNKFSVIYDSASIMTYCESIFERPIRLSAEDIAAVNNFYRTQ